MRWKLERKGKTLSAKGAKEREEMQNSLNRIFFGIEESRVRQVFLDALIFLRDPSRPSRIIAFFLG
jgi:hypothetical protein